MKDNHYKFAIIKFNEEKLNTTESNFTNRLEKHIQSDGFNYFINNKEYKNIQEQDLENIEYALVLTYKKDENNEPVLLKIYWCQFRFERTKPKNKLILNALYDSDADTVIENAASCILLDIENDFEENTYITIEYSPKIFEQFQIFMKPYKDTTNKERTYEAKESETGLDSLAQRNEYCLRTYNLKDPASNDRTEYLRDYDRIVYSKALRRLANKTQVFSSSKGDHYRVRMTHTMIVCQIARSISDALHLNTGLAQAIALGHDLGHTPFGHAGERALNDLLHSEDKNAGGFNHNYQGLRVVSKLENQYTEIDGLDLSYQVLDGIFKHTSAKKDVSLEAFIENQKSLLDYISQSEYAVTLEGQVVAAADEIAQRSHDIDDAITSKLLTLEDFNNYLELNKFKDLKKKIDEIEDRLADENIKIISDKTELISAQISSAIIKFFIEDVCDQSRKEMKSFKERNGDELQPPYILREKLINFSESGAHICEYLEKVVKNSIITSNEVSTTDQNARSIISALFHTYLDNPKLLHNGTKRRIYADFANQYHKKNIKNLIPLTGSSDKALTKEFNKIKQHCDEEYTLKYRILLRNICDFIAGMTDTYALNEYKRICQNTPLHN